MKYDSRKKSWLPVLALAGHLIACGSDHSVPALSFPSAPTTGAIINGTASPDAAVVAFVIQDQVFCSGTLITPTVVVTASHCVDATALGFSPIAFGEVFFGSSVSAGGETRAISRINVHPNWAPSGFGDDIAFVELASAAPAAITPIPHLPSSLGLTSADVGTSIRMAGFGRTETGSTGERLEFVGSIDFVCATTTVCQGFLPPFTFTYPHQGGGPCSGDSGGATLVDRAGAIYLAGVNTNVDSVDNNCAVATYGVDMLVDGYETLINDFIAGVDVGPEFSTGTTTPLPVCPDCDNGAGCINDAQCGSSGFCFDEATYPEMSGGFCTSFCLADIDCAGDAACIPTGQGYQLCWDSCVTNADCRPNYECYQQAGSPSLCVAAESVAGCDDCDIGAPCLDDLDCGSNGFCYSQASFPDFTDGYCSSYCPTGECAGDGVCAVTGGGTAVCVDGCEAARDCRADYSCSFNSQTSSLECIPPGFATPSATGEPCVSSALCAAGYCALDPGLANLGAVCRDFCATNADCGAQEVCDLASGQCEAAPPGCTADADCAAGELCNLLTGACETAPAGCTNDAECGAGEICDVVSGICEAAPTGCTDDANCDAGEFCDLASGVCETVAAGCTDDAACSVGTVCDVDTGACVAENVDPGDPEPGGCSGTGASGDGFAGLCLMILVLRRARRRDKRRLVSM